MICHTMIINRRIDTSEMFKWLKLELTFMLQYQHVFKRENISRHWIEHGRKFLHDV